MVDNTLLVESVWYRIEYKRKGDDPDVLRIDRGAAVANSFGGWYHESLKYLAIPRMDEIATQFDVTLVNLVRVVRQSRRKKPEIENRTFDGLFD